MKDYTQLRGMSATMFMDDYEDDDYESFEKVSHKAKLVRRDKDAAIKAQRKAKREREAGM